MPRPPDLAPAITRLQLNLLGSHDTPRLRSICGGDLDSVRLAILLQMTLPGAPCIYYGDEIGMEGGMDPDCRGAFPTDASNWEQPPHDWLVDAIALRASSLDDLEVFKPQMHVYAASAASWDARDPAPRSRWEVLLGLNPPPEIRAISRTMASLNRSGPR